MIESLERRALLTAETLTFNSFQTSGGGDTNLGYSINDSGFIIASLGANPLYSRYSSTPWSGIQGTTVFNGTANGFTRLSRADGGTFKLNAIQLNSLNSFAPSTVPFTGTLSAGGTSTFNLNTDNNWNSFQTFSSPLSSNLTQLQWQQISNAGDFHQFDNIAVVIGPKISSFSPVSPNPRLTAVAAINVALTDAADLGSFTFADLTLTRNGSPIVLNSSIAISLLTGTTYQISGLTALTNLEGTYQLTLNARTILGAGTGLDGSGSGSVTWTNTSPPTVVATSPTLTGGTLAAGTTSLQVTFSSPTAFALGSSQRPAGSASQILTANPTASSGIYWFDTDGVGPNAPFQAYADMTTAGGGWMLAVNSVLGSEPASNRPDANAGTVGLSTAHTRNFNDYLGGSLQIRHQIDANNQGQGTFDAFYTGPYNAALPSGFAGFTNITTTNQGLLNAQYGQPFGANAFGAAWYGNAFSAIPSTPSGGFSGGPAINNNPAQVINSYRIWIRNSAASGGSQNGGADTASNYQLRSQGADGLLGNADDTIVPLGVSYTGTTATLSFPSLTDGVYRLTVKDSITNETGTAIDGDANSTAGGNWVRDFVVGALSTSLTSPNGFAFDPEFGGFGAGQLVQGPGNAFDGLNRLQIGGTEFSANASSTVNVSESSANVSQTQISSSFANLSGLSTTITTSSANPVRLSSAFNLYVSPSSNWANVEVRFVVDGTPLPVAATILTHQLFSGNSQVIPVVVEDYVTLAAGLRTITIQARQLNDPVNGGAPSSFPIFVDDGATASIRAIELLAAGRIAESFANITQAQIASSFTSLSGLSTTITTSGANPVRLSSAFNLYVSPTSGWGNVEVRFVVDGTPLPVAATILTPSLSGGNPQVIPVVLEDYVTLAAGLRTITIQARQINDPAAGGAPSTFPIIVDDGATASIRAIEFSSQPLSSDGGTTLSTNRQTISGVDVRREVTVPSVGAGDFSRTVDTFTNATVAPISIPVRTIGNLGSDAATTVFATSDGDLLVEPTDLWFGTDDANGSGTPAIIHLLHGPFGLQPINVNVIDDNVEWTYDLTVPAGETKRLASFTVLGTTRAEAIAAANALVTTNGFGGQAAAFLTTEELASLVNFQFNSAPTNIAITNGSIAENSGANGVVGTLSFTDPNPGDTATFILPSEFGSNALFNIAPDGITLRANSSFNFEVQNSYSITVRVTDAGGLSFDKQFTISVTDVNEAPTAVSFQNVVSTLPENTSTSSRIRVADIVVTDDALGTNGLTVTGPDAAFFEISGTQLFLKSGTTLNFEGKPTFSVTVQVDDPTVGSTPDLTVPYSLTLTDVNEAPTAVTLQNLVSTLPENTSTSSRIKVADIVVTDDALGTNGLAVTGPDAASFEIDGTQLFLKAGVSLDFESKSSFNVNVVVDDTTLGAASELIVGYQLTLTNVTELQGIDTQLGQTQRSYVRYLDVLFDQSNDLMTMINSGRFQLTKRDLNGLNPANVALTPSMFSTVGNSARIDFGANGLGGNRNTNAGDGYYELGVDQDGNGSFESKKYFYRLLGDVNGDRKVDTADSSLVVSSFGTSNPNRDVNGDGIVNANDRTLVLRALGRKLKDDLFLDE